MNRRDCWRLTDNRHWDSPARMADGRIFTDWRSACKINNDIATRAGMGKGLSHSYSDMLQQTNGAIIYRNIAESRAVSGDPWARIYIPPPAKQIIVPVARQGVEMLEQNVPNAIGAVVDSGKNEVKTNGSLSQGNPRISDCSAHVMPTCDPRWGLSPSTLVLNLRDAAPNGGNTTSWLRGTMDNDRA